MSIGGFSTPQIAHLVIVNSLRRWTVMIHVARLLVEAPFRACAQLRITQPTPLRQAA